MGGAGEDNESLWMSGQHYEMFGAQIILLLVQVGTWKLRGVLRLALARRKQEEGHWDLARPP